MPIPIGILAGSKFTASGPAPTFYVDAGNASSYPGSGTTWTDIAGGAAGTMNGPVSYNSGDGGRMDFTPNSWVDFGDVNATELASGDFTFSVWFKFDGTDECAILDKGWNAGGWMLWHVSGTIQFYRGGGRFALTGMTTGVWRQIIFRFQSSSNSLEAFINGVSQGAVSIAGAVPSANSSAFQIGRYATENINGKVTEVRFYNVRLSDAEVAALWTSTKTRHGY